MIKFVIFDFDGVFTDGNVLFENNEVKKFYNIKDGKGLSLLRNNNIKYGLITNFNTKLNLKINDLDFKNFIKHLNFNYYYIGSNNKKNILDDWLKKENLKYSDVAYIGDDLNDLELLKIVNLSGCPNDSVQEVKNVCNYVCKNKGGNLCVREFCEKVINNFSSDELLLNQIKDNFNYQINNFDLDKINKLVKFINQTYNNIYFIGVGKSGNIAKHCCDLLKSISIKCFYLDCLNLLHGDIGVIHKNIVILFSNSGNTNEIIKLFPYFKNRECTLVTIVCNNNSIFEKKSNLNIILPFKNEINGEISKIPTNSYMSQLIFCNILVSKLKLNLNLKEYYQNHPSGSIGKDLLKIKEVLINEFPLFTKKENYKLNDILLEMTKFKIGCCYIIDENKKLLGILTDGDIRRILLKDNNRQLLLIRDINNKFIYETNENKLLGEYKNINGFIPLLKNGILIGIFRY